MILPLTASLSLWSLIATVLSIANEAYDAAAVSAAVAVVSGLFALALAARAGR